MKLKTLDAFQTEVILNNGNVVFFSYSTPVAAQVKGLYYCTHEFFSRTTNMHIHEWLNGRIAEYKPQSFFNALIK